MFHRDLQSVRIILGVWETYRRESPVPISTGGLGTRSPWPKTKQSRRSSTCSARSASQTSPPKCNQACVSTSTRSTSRLPPFATTTSRTASIDGPLQSIREHIILTSCLPPKGGRPPRTCSGHQDPRARPCLHVPLQPCRASLSGRSASRRSFMAHGPSSGFTCAAAPGTAPKVVPASRLWHCAPMVGGMASHGPDGGDKLEAQSIRTSVSPCWPRRTRYTQALMHPAPGT